MHTISAILPSIYQNLLILVEIWRSSNENKNAQFFETRCLVWAYEKLQPNFAWWVDQSKCDENFWTVVETPCLGHNFCDTNGVERYVCGG